MNQWCSGYYCYTTSFNSSWNQVLRRFKPCSRCVRDLQWWGSLTVVLPGNKAKRLSSVSHTTKQFIITTSQFFFKLSSFFSVMRDNCETLFDLDSGTHWSAKFQTFDCSREISPNLYFHRLLLLGVYKISAKKSIEELCLMTLKNDAKFEEKHVLFQKWQKFGEFWSEHWKFSKFPLWLVPFVQSI